MSGTSDDFLDSFLTGSFLLGTLDLFTPRFGERLDGAAAEDRELGLEESQEWAILGSPEAVNVSLLVA